MYQWLTVPLAYLIGSITGGAIVGHFWGKVDIRELGSGNVGATNTLRVMGLPAALTVLAIDAGKGALAVYLAGLLGGGSPVILAAAVAVVVGHNWPLFFGFKGGKGVATTAGLLAVIDIRILAILVAVMLLIILMTRYVSLGSLVDVFLMPVAFWYLNYDLEYIVFTAIISAIAIYRHRTNIARLWRGEESKLGERLKQDKQQ